MQCRLRGRRRAAADCTDAELLWQVGCCPQWAAETAEHLTRSCGGASGLLRLTGRELMALGVPPPVVAQWLAVAELARRFAMVPLRKGQPFRSSADLFRHFAPLFRDLKKEQFWNILLDGKNRVLDRVMISEGSLTSSLVHPREVFVPAIRNSAASLVFVHNHPSGDPAPSREDLEITRRLVETGRIVGIRVLDHVIIGLDSYVSLADRGLLGDSQACFGLDSW